MAPLDYSPPANPHMLPPATVRSESRSDGGRAWREYTVRPGDNLTKIAAAHDTSIKALVAKNKLKDPRHLVTGSKLKVPGPAPQRSAAPATDKKADPQRSAAKAQTPTRFTRVHTVKPGEHLTSIAAKYGTTWRAIAKANKLSDARMVHVGKALRVPAPAQEEKAKPESPKKDADKADATPTADRDNTFLGRTYPDEVVAKAAENRHKLEHTDVPSRSQTRDLIVRTAQKYGVDPKLALGISWQESGWNQRSVSVANAVGIMQVMPATGEWCGRMAGRKLDLMDPQDNVTAGIVFLRWLTEHADSPEHAIAGYYQGLGSVEAKGMYDDTEDYVANVKAHMTRF